MNSKENYFKYRNIENIQFLGLKLYRLRLFIQVNVLPVAQEEFKQPINQLQYQFRSRN